ncbi:MAG: tyrosine-type recombinase/integrase [Polyangiaceae bacterium]
MTALLTPLPSPVASVATFGAAMTLPALVGNAGAAAATATLEFFTARIPNANTREAYGRAVRRFAVWCSEGGVTLHSLNAVNVAAYLEQLDAEGMSVPSVKQHFAGIRHWLDYLTQKGVIPFNPALSVRGPRLTSNEGKTPVLERREVRALFDSIAGGDLVALRDRALLAVMLFNIPRVSAVCAMRCRDFDDTGDGWLLLHEKRGKERRLPAHHQVREAVRAYIQAAGLVATSKAPLFQSAPARSGALSGKPMHRSDVWSMVKRRCRDAGLSPSISNHSFRATGLTIHHENGGSLQAGAELAGHESTRTTQRYVRTTGKSVRAEVERVQI